MKTKQKETVARLKTLYDKKGENQVFARMHVRLPDELIRRLDHAGEQISLAQFPSADQVFPLWEEYLAFFDTLEDDWVPAIYPRQFDQGIYGAIFGAPVHLNHAGTPGWVSSMSAPLQGKSYEELLQLAGHLDEQWLQRLERDLHDLAARSGERWGVAVPITIDGFNLCEQMRGEQLMLDIYDCPEELKRFIAAGVGLNIKVVERQRAAIGKGYAGGVCDFFNGGWMPAGAIPMSVDCYNLCRPEVYAEFGRPYQQQLIDHFGGGNFHLHGNGRQLLPELAKLKGLVVSSIGNDGNKVAAFDDLEQIKRQAGPVVPVVPCMTDAFVQKLHDRSLTGGVYYSVGPVASIAQANRLMESVRSYRV